MNDSSLLERSRMETMMPRFLLIAVLLVLSGNGKSYADIILIDYGAEGSSPTLGGTWNSFANPVDRALLNSGGGATGITISFGTGFELGDDQGSWPAGDKEWVDGNATADFFFSRSSTSEATVTFSGLQVGSLWRFDAVAARARSASARVGDFTVNGSFGDSMPNGNDFNARNDGWDGGNILSWNSVVADQNGEIELTVNAVSSFAYLNASRLVAVPEPTSMAMFSLGIAVAGLSRRRERAVSRD